MTWEEMCGAGEIVVMIGVDMVGVLFGEEGCWFLSE